MSRLFVILPAAGSSRRMGQPKLLLPWRGKPVICHLLDSFQHKQVAARVVVTRKDDKDLQDICGKAGADVIARYEDPPDMRTSVASAIDYLSGEYEPKPTDGWILCPADFPRLSAETIGQLIVAWNDRANASADPAILRPVKNEKHGHPVFFSWSLAAKLADIPADQGLDWIVHEYADHVHNVSIEQDEILFDLDTPDDYEQLKQL